MEAPNVPKKLAEFDRIWNHGRSIEGKVPHYTTGQAAKILGIRNIRRVARMIDEGAIKGHSVNGKHGNSSRSYRVVFHRDLIEYIKKHGSITAWRWLVAQKAEAFEKTLARESCLSGVLHGFGKLPDCLRKVVKNLDPIDELAGASADKKRIKVFQQLISFMDLHINLRVLIAKSKRVRK